jgi:MFS family permease
MSRDWILISCACAIQVATYACFFNLTPLYPQVAHELGMDAGALGALVGVGGIVALLAQLPAGSGGDAFGRGPFFAAGMVCLLAALGLRWQAHTPAALLAGQLFAGAALGMCSLNAFALAADLSAKHKQGRSIGLVNASVSVGQVLGYLVAGGMGASVGWHDLSLAMVVLPLLILVLVLRVRELSQRPAHSTLRAGPLGILRALSHPSRLALSALAALTLAGGSGAAYLLPFALQTQDLGPLAAALVLVPYVFGSVLMAPFSGDLAARFGAARVIVVALLLGAATCGALFWAGGLVPALILANVLLGAAVNTTLPIVSLLVVSMRAGGDQIGPGTAIAGVRVGQSLGPFLGPTLAGSALARGGPEWAWVSLGMCLLGSLALLGIASRST